mmetsp:Transcript_22967/g.50037  ORF Transcript_22967/g.50037 Transcript_22967/m.50037 type:complete len:156 (+) Transcript_22967:5187-5654(+)
MYPFYLWVYSDLDARMRLFLLDLSQTLCSKVQQNRLWVGFKSSRVHQQVSDWVVGYFALHKGNLIDHPTLSRAALLSLVSRPEIKQVLGFVACSMPKPWFRISAESIIRETNVATCKKQPSSSWVLGAVLGELSATRHVNCKSNGRVLVISFLST